MAEGNGARRTVARNRYNAARRVYAGGRFAA
jgi:hypothetical protein